MHYALRIFVNKTAERFISCSAYKQRSFDLCIVALVDLFAGDDSDNIVRAEFVYRHGLLVVLKEPACYVVNAEKSLELLTFEQRDDRRVFGPVCLYQVEYRLADLEVACRLHHDVADLRPYILLIFRYLDPHYIHLFSDTVRYRAAVDRYILVLRISQVLESCV